jgi:hypothetical protein
MKAEKGTGINWFSDLMALSLLVAMVLYFSYEMVWEDKIPFFRDLGPYFYTMRFSLAQSFKAGEIPLWDRHTAMGFPLLADFQSGTFYPPHLFYLIFSFFTAIKATFLFHYLVAATGSYFLCRQWKYPSYLAMIGAMLFTLGGTTVSLTNLLNHFQTAVWLPWVLLLGERCFRVQSWKNFLFFTSALLFQFLAGSPEIYVMTLGLLVFDGLRIAVEERSIAWYKVLLSLLAANALVVGMAMVQILPTAELFLESRARHRISYTDNIQWSLHPLRLINLFFLDSEVVPSVISGVKLFTAKDMPFLLTLYMGALALPGMCLWALRSSLREKTILSGLVVFSLLLALGDYTPLYNYIFRFVPTLSFIRFPEKFVFATYALLLFVVLRGVFLFSRSEEVSSRAPFVVLSIICFLELLLYLFLRWEKESLIRFIAWATQIQPFSPLFLNRYSGLLVHLERQTALTFGVFLLFLLKYEAKLRDLLFKVLLVALVSIDLFLAHKPYQYLISQNIIYESPRVIPNPDPEPYRLFYYPGSSDLHPSYYFILRQPSLAELNSMMFSNLLPNTGVFYGFDYMQEIDALARWPYGVFLSVANKLPPEKQYRLLANLNVKHITSFQPLPEKDIALVRHFQEHPSWLYKVNHVIPRAYIVPKAVVEKEPVKVLNRLSNKRFDPLKEVILEQPLRIPGKKGFQAHAKITRYRNQEVTIRASLNGSGVLVLADSFYPGWRVYVDGEEKKILRANFFFRGVPLEAGEHLVEFRYQPRSLAIGLIISLVTISGVGLWSVFLAWKQRRGV